MDDLNTTPVIFKNKAVIAQYFPDLKEKQRSDFEALGELYATWNARINVISRKDITYLYPRHILHSLAIAKIYPFQAGAEVLDLGTGGGFPGIPLAILFPKTKFYLVDSVQKKIKVVARISEELGLKNVTPLCQRAETIERHYDCIISRAVASLSTLSAWTKGKLKAPHTDAFAHGLFCWKGGDLTAELQASPMQYERYPLTDIFPIPFFHNKSIVHLY